MQIEDIIAANTAALIENTKALREVLAAGIPTNVVPITEAPKEKPAKSKAKAAAVVVTEPEPEIEKPTKVAVEATKEEEFSDPLDKTIEVVSKGSPAPEKPEIDVDSVIAKCIDVFKTKMTEAEGERKNQLKDEFPKLRAKWGLAEGAKLITLADRPENLVGLLKDIEAL